ncbi:carboxylesterase [Brevundimonas sp. MYb46]|nr:carboxylesterase [Brevundimonas sp. MYb31]PRA27400.1 carboxylesterase [Brevundimonas sp. MYb27]PRB17789.1 carboxylesterase [Brevundimonas sp. MYb52]PRB38159.1 carboxylesterase [Brevundimonas sp. MYb46]PRB56058.1 carboxylesterase [Brevundimonas sp. MYb33]
MTGPDRRTVTSHLLIAGMSAMIPARSFAATGDPIARTRQGRAKGFVRNGASIFLGLPYGADTGGARRFRPPAPPVPWQGVRDATRPGQRAPQAGTGPMTGPFADYFTGNRSAEIAAMPETLGEDCLVLNVVTPAVDRARRPVLVYIHGGGFTSGTGLVGTLGDRFTVAEDVVLVTVNHRLGALGYMYMGGASPDFADGNPGMLDLVAALRWVRDNIGAFGGDPTNVTLFGESGGGIKVSLLLAMPQAQGLFRRAIIQSGLYPDPIAPQVAAEQTRDFMARVGASDVAALQRLPFDRFTGAGAPGNLPVADGRTLTAQPWAQAPATAANVPLLLGYCKDELTLFALGQPGLFDLKWPDVPSRLAAAKLGLPPEAAPGVVDAYRTAFPSDTPSDSYFRISSDASFGRAMVTLADLKSDQSPPVYFYRMDLDTRLPPGLRAMHTAELPLTIGLSPRPDADTLTKQISGAWAAFARKGDPNHPGMPRWRPYRPADQEMMVFDQVSSSGPDPQAAPRAMLREAIGSGAQYNPL